jgi:hypothetical protein
MNNNKEFIIEELLDSQESISFILNAQLATEIAKELLEYGIEFTECDDFYELITQNDILSIAKNVYDDGQEDYFFENVLAENGQTLWNESDVVYIESDLLDIIDESRLSGLVVELSDDEDYSDECLGDCEYCNGCDDEDLNTDTQIVEEYLESKIEEFFKVLEDNTDNDEFCFHCAVKDMLEQVYCVSYEDGKNSLAISLQDLLGDIVED